MAEHDRRFGLHKGEFPRSIVSPTLKAAGIGTVAAAGTILAITWRNHRELAHKSITLSPTFQAFLDLEERTMGMDTSIWASVHRIHHEMEDATLYPFLQVYRAIRSVEDRRDLYEHVPIPYEFANLDPFVDAFSKDQVIRIGRMAEDHLKERLGDRYKEPNRINDEEIVDRLYNRTPQYYYPDYKKMLSASDYSQADIERILLTDPHSPALQRPEKGHLNGVKAEARNNVKDYKRPGNLFKARPDLKPEDLRRSSEDENRSNVAPVIAGFAIPAAITLFARHKFKPEDVVIAAAAGGAANGMRLLTAVGAGRLVNADGHGGRLTGRDFWRANTADDFQIRVKDDGSLTTDTVDAGIMGRIASILSFDEVGGQAEHHKNPGKIAYTSKGGFRKFIDAPWGSFTEFLAESGVGFINRNKGFELKNANRRPDEVHPAVKLIQQARVQQMQKIR